jgi:hypothetical protein
MLNAFIAGDIGEVSLIPCTEDAATGVPTKVTAKKTQFRLALNNAGTQGAANQEDIRSITNLQINNVNLARGRSYEFGEIMTTTTTPSKLIDLIDVQGYELFYITFVTGGQTLQGYGRTPGTGSAFDDDGKKVVTASFSPTAHGVDALTWVVTP